MEGSATNEVKQGKKKSKERESPCEKEKEIHIPFDAEREKEILSDLLREGNTEMENIEVRQQERKSKDKEKETPPGFVGERTTKTEAHPNVEVIRESETKSEEREIGALPNAERKKNNPFDFSIREREMEMEMEALADNEVRGSKKKSEERENRCERKKDIPPSEREKEKETPPDAEMEKDAPPNDDICPICFENYNIPCKTNCGHWYCGKFLLCESTCLVFNFLLLMWDQFKALANSEYGSRKMWETGKIHNKFCIKKNCFGFSTFIFHACKCNLTKKNEISEILITSCNW